MNQEERREKRKKDTQSAVIVVAVFFIVLTVLIGGIVFAVHKFVKPGADKPEKNTESVTTEATEEPETTPVTEVSDPLMDQAMQIAAGMTLEQKVAQMFMITPDALTGVDGATMAGDSTKTTSEAGASTAGTSTTGVSDLYGKEPDRNRSDGTDAYQYEELQSGNSRNSSVPRCG